MDNIDQLIVANFQAGINPDRDNIDQLIVAIFPAGVNPENIMFNQPNSSRQPAIGKKKIGMRIF
jgi:hypothetical protein